ncbi:MAG TPA: DUF2127 domain-containing protein [Thermoanaerobaculia bacterium]|jgi:uncharacterized membrane protein (DUF2068 family)
MRLHSRHVLRLIAIFRHVKAVLLIVSGLAVLHLIRPGAVEQLTGWVTAMPFTTRHAFVGRGVAMITRLPPKRIEELATVFFLYATLFIVEGAGLWMGKLWAEWLTIVATTSFIPFEGYEVVRRPTWISVSLLVANVVIVIYLVYRRLTLRLSRS